MTERSRRPHSSPTQTGEAIELALVELRRAHPCWGGRKLHQVLIDRSHANVPAPSTITHILRRHGLMPERATGQGRPWKRFEHESPNDLWQMDFKGTIAVGTGQCDPLTVLDDHSRYNLVLRATPDMRITTVQAVLTETFRRHGLPLRMNMDNGSPWGSPSGQSRGLCGLTLWMVRVGIQVSFSTPAHPQTNGKDERFHRSLKAEVVTGRVFTDHAHIQRVFDEWRDIYNTVRPHQGIGMVVPSTRYRPSPRPFPEVLPAIEYSPHDHVVMVQWNGVVRFKGRTLKVSNALHGMHIAFRPHDTQEGIYALYFAHHRLMEVDLRETP